MLPHEWFAPHPTKFQLHSLSFLHTYKKSIQPVNEFQATAVFGEGQLVRFTEMGCKSIQNAPDVSQQQTYN